MNWITPIRVPRAQKIALAVLNAGHPGPMPPGPIKGGNSRKFYKALITKSSCFVLNP